MSESRELARASQNALESFKVDVYYEDCLRAYCETRLSKSQISQLFGVPLSKLGEWEVEYEWLRVREAYLRTHTSVEVVQNTIEHVLEYSETISEQVGHVGNMLLKDAYVGMLEDPLALTVKDRLGFALKFKELEAKVKGQIQTGSSTTIVNQNAVYKKLVHEGVEGFYGDSEESDSSLEVIDGGSVVVNRNEVED